MTVLEVWILAATVASAGPGEPPDSEPPPVELLEFIGDWSGEEARLIDDYRPPEKPADTEVKNNAPDKAVGD